MSRSEDRTDPATDPPSISPAFRSLLGQALGDEPAGPAVDSWRIGRFEVLDEIDGGGCGVVLRVFDPVARAERAMKVPNLRTLGSDFASSRFLDEGRKLARVDHPNVARLYEVDDSRGVPYLVMKYYPEGSLSKWQRRREGRPVCPRWAASLVAGLADGVAAIARAEMLHRDLKPGNVLLERIGDDDDPGDPPRLRAVVADLGMAKFLDDSAPPSHPTHPDEPIGTYLYMSPEAAKGARHIGRASDVYGLGVILFELLAGRPPFTGPGRAEVVAKITADAPPPSPRSIRRDLPRDLDRICRTAMAKAPGDRYTSAGAMAADLRAFVNGDPIRGSGWPRRLRAAIRHRKRLAAGGLIALGLLGVGAVETRREALSWIRQVEAASVPSLPALVKDRPAWWLVDGDLKALARSGTDRQKLAAMVALAGPDRARTQAVADRMIAGPFEDVGPICRALDGRAPGLVDALRDRASGGRGTESSRANAALALVHLGRPSDGLALFREIRDPGGRAYLVHRLGPSGVAPATLVAALEASGGADTPIRRGLLLAMGEVPTGAWRPADRERATGRALALYRADPDPGVHGAAKWLLKSWGQGPTLATIDRELSEAPAPPGQGWRVGRSLLTFVRVDLGGPAIEVADTELTIGQARSLDVLPVGYLGLKGQDDLPATGLSYELAARLCLAIDRVEQVAPGPAADRPGFRMPDDAEFPGYVRAGTGCDRPYGEAFEFVDRYVQTFGNRPGPLHPFPVATAKPNDLGLFDTLGNVAELGRWTGPGGNPQNRAALLGGDLLRRGSDLSAATVAGPQSNRYTIPLSLRHGLRVVRTLEVREPRP